MAGEPARQPPFVARRPSSSRTSPGGAAGSSTSRPASSRIRWSRSP